jgi:starch synthase
MHPLIDWDVSDGDLNMLQQGVTAADFINTVSPSYAKEILTKEFGDDMFEILKAREGRIEGILNGLDYTQFPKDYNKSDWRKRKPERKTELQKKFGLKVDAKKPVVCYIGRIDPYQKGIDLIYDAIPEILKEGSQFVLLGAGDKEWMTKLQKMKDEYTGKDLSLNLLFSVDLATEIYAAADYIIVPSRYEPCGLIQMIAMWYGTLPIVHSVGGLKDTVKEGKNGYKFDSFNAKTLVKTVTKAISGYNGQAYFKMVEEAMGENFGWDKSAQKYAKLYKEVIQLREESLNQEVL